MQSQSCFGRKPKKPLCKLQSVKDPNDPRPRNLYVACFCCTVEFRLQGLRLCAVPRRALSHQMQQERLALPMQHALKTAALIQTLFQERIKTPYAKFNESYALLRSGSACIFTYQATPHQPSLERALHLASRAFTSMDKRGAPCHGSTGSIMRLARLTNPSAAS